MLNIAQSWWTWLAKSSMFHLERYKTRKNFSIESVLLFHKDIIEMEIANNNFWNRKKQNKNDLVGHTITEILLISTIDFFYLIYGGLNSPKFLKIWRIKSAGNYVRQN